MKRIILTVITLISMFTIKAQNEELIRNFIEFSPSKATKVNGLSIKYWDTLDDTNYNKKINGIELGLNPLGVFFPFLTAIHSLNPFEIEPPLFT